jgi:hypothetical protein
LSIAAAQESKWIFSSWSHRFLLDKKKHDEYSSRQFLQASKAAKPMIKKMDG